MIYFWCKAKIRSHYIEKELTMLNLVVLALILCSPWIYFSIANLKVELGSIIEKNRMQSYSP